jgi:hypothetical protein
MADLGITMPRNDVVAGKYRTERLGIGANATIAMMLPGAAVQYDTNEHDVKEATANCDVIGFLGYGMAHSAYKPATRDTAYTAVGDEVPVHNGGGFLVRAPTASASYTKGDHLTTDSSGCVKAGTVGTDDIVGRVEKATSSETSVWMISMV